MVLTIMTVTVMSLLEYYFFTCSPGHMAESGDPRRQVTCLNKAKARRTLLADSELRTF